MSDYQRIGDDPDSTFIGGTSRSKKKRGLIAALVIVLFVFGGIGATIALTWDHSKPEPKLWELIQTEDVTKHLNSLYNIAMNTTDKNRACGTEGYARSVDYVVGQLNATGFFDVTVQPFEVNQYIIEASELELTQPLSVPFLQTYQFDVIYNSAITNVTGTITSVANQGCNAADYMGPNIALIQRTSPSPCTIKEAADVAATAGAKGVLFIGPPGKSFRGIYGPTRAGPLSAIPLMGVSGTIAQTLSKPGVAVRMDVGATVKNMQTWNVIAQTRTGSAENVIVVGSHLDSVPAGPGINDNGSGSSCNLATALAAASANLVFTSQVRFCWWGAEELGLLGSIHYVNSLNKTEFAKVLLNLNFDMLASPNGAREVNQVNPNSTTVPAATIGASNHIEALFREYFDERGLVHVPAQIDSPGRSDYAGFLDAGIPAGGLSTGAEVLKSDEEMSMFGGFAHVQLDFCYHLKCDVWPQNINQDLLIGNAQALAFTMEHLATHDNVRTWLYPSNNNTIEARALRRESDSPIDSEWFADNWSKQDAMLRELSEF